MYSIMGNSQDNRDQVRILWTSIYSALQHFFSISPDFPRIFLKISQSNPGPPRLDLPGECHPFPSHPRTFSAPSERSIDILPYYHHSPFLSHCHSSYSSVLYEHMLMKRSILSSRMCILLRYSLTRSRGRLTRKTSTSASYLIGDLSVNRMNIRR